MGFRVQALGLRVGFKVEGSVCWFSGRHKWGC